MVVVKALTARVRMSTHSRVAVRVKRKRKSSMLLLPKLVLMSS